MRVAKIPPHFFIVHLTLMLAPAAFAGVVYFLIQSGEAQAALPEDQSVVFLTVAAVMAVIAVGFSQLLPRFFMRGEKSVPLQKYFTMKIVQWAMIEGAALFISVIFFLSHHMNLLIPIGVLIALLAVMRPTTDEMERLNVKAEE